MANATDFEAVPPRDVGPATGHHPHVIRFWVDGEEYETHRHELTPNEIIREFGKLDPATHYLVEIKGHHKRSFQGEGDRPIKIHEGERFQIISIGPTPVSDVNAKTGVDAFLKGLIALGYAPNQLAGRADHIVLDYAVETGSHAGETVRLGLIVPPDFPLTPPGGPHVSPLIHPFNPSGAHPSGHIHRVPFTTFPTRSGRALAILVSTVS